MPETQAFPLRTKSGRRGQVFRRARFLDRGGVSRVQLDDGTELSVPAASLTVEPDGSFLLDDAGVRSAPEEFAAPLPTAAAAPEAVSELAAPPAASEPVIEAPPPEFDIAPPPQEDVVPEPAWEAAPVAAAEQTYQSEPTIPYEVIEQEVRTMAPKWQLEEAVSVGDPLFTEDVQVERVTINRMLDAPLEVRQDGDTTIIPVVEEVITVQKRLLLREEVRITRRRVEVREPRKLTLNGPQPRTFGADGREIETVS
jgi:uncharacterized protein (TIGR02271 family)